MKPILRIVQIISLIGLLQSCSTMVPGNETGSEPINDQEAMEYKRRLHKCYASGGTRIVKIKGKLMCYN